MPRKGPAPRRPLVIDPVYTSPLVTQLVNKVLLDGKPDARLRNLDGLCREIDPEFLPVRCRGQTQPVQKDRLVPIQYARDLAARLGGPVTTLYLEGTGHAITVDARRRDLAEASIAFLREAVAVPLRAA